MKIGIISDLHSNLAATKAVFNKLESIGVEEILCTGDLIGYYTNPLEIIDFVRSRTKYVICGNHDAIAISDDLDEMQYFNSVAREALVWTRDLLATNKEYWDYIRNLPLTLKIELDGVKILLAHGTPTEPEDWEYFYYFGVIDQEAVMNDWLETFDANLIVIGHTHVPFFYDTGEKPFRGVINPGSVGQPRDGDPRTSFAVFDTESPDSTILHRINYPIAQVIRGVKKAGLPDILGRRLLVGR